MRAYLNSSSRAFPTAAYQGHSPTAEMTFGLGGRICRITNQPWLFMEQCPLTPFLAPFVSPAPDCAVLQSFSPCLEENLSPLAARFMRRSVTELATFPPIV